MVCLSANFQPTTQRIAKVMANIRYIARPRRTLYPATHQCQPSEKITRRFRSSKRCLGSLTPLTIHQLRSSIGLKQGWILDSARMSCSKYKRSSLPEEKLRFWGIVYLAVDGWTHAQHCPTLGTTAVFPEKKPILLAFDRSGTRETGRALDENDK